MTPCPEVLPSASPFFLPKIERFDDSYEDMSLGDVQGVYIDDGGQLFSNDHHSPISPFHESHSMSASQRY